MPIKDVFLISPAEAKAQNERVLAALTEAQPDWVSLWDLEKASGSWRVKDRVKALRDYGWKIENRRLARNGVNQSWYRLANL